MKVCGWEGDGGDIGAALRAETIQNLGALG